MSRASVSSNIAEGQSCGHLRDSLRFIDNVRGPVAKLGTQTFLVGKPEFPDQCRFDSVATQVTSVGRPLNPLKNALQKRENAYEIHSQ
ncbi:four helix bundle protein [Candidatus Sumerlaeota bacterium]|nr:four helix bundle protein [Candidatus Sumerlaeota bacterium]